MGARGAKPQYATPYGAYGPKVGQIPNPAVRPAARPGYGYAPPAYTSAPAVAPRPAYAPAFSSPAAQLDAADGVMDGRYFGSPIVGQGAAPMMAPTYGYAAPTYTAAPFASSMPAFGGFAPTYTGFPGYGTSFASPFGNSALALDAADGVIDGTYFGAGIAAPSFGGFPATYGAPATFGAPVSYGAAPMYGGYGGGYGGYGYGF